MLNLFNFGKLLFSNNVYLLRFCTSDNELIKIGADKTNQKNKGIVLNSLCAQKYASSSLENSFINAKVAQN